MVCETCGKQFQADAYKRFCCIECRRKWQKSDRQRVVTHNLCKWCGKPIKEARNRDYCCRPCSYADLHYWREYHLAERERLAQLKRIIALLKGFESALKQAQTPPKFCKECGCKLPKRRHKFCSNECSRKAYRRTEAFKELRRAGKRLRRARKRGAKGKCFTYVSIFNRDGWTCQLCHRPTPKELRGTQNPAAPELDHIVPLSKGGKHIPSNVQCLCRECNEYKSNKLYPKGLFKQSKQMGFPAF